MELAGKSVTGYSTMRFTNGRDWWEFQGAGSWACGTSLVYRKDWWETHQFKSIQVGEDGQFVMEAQKYKQIIGAPAGDMMIATIHGKNTSPRRLSEGRQYGWYEAEGPAMPELFPG